MSQRSVISERPNRPTNRHSREEMQEQIIQREEEERRRMKELMIRICSYLEDRYLESIKKIILEREPNLHYDIDLE